MRSSYKILKIFGISVELHITFLLLLVGFFAWGWLSDGLVSGIQTLVFFIIIFTIVVMHELSHSIVAILNGIKVTRIILLPIGGVASIEIPEKPIVELMMSIAGPFFNFVMAFLCILLLSIVIPVAEIPVILQGLEEPSLLVSSAQGILVLLLWINMMLGLFNLVPAFPMDGGRIFRSILALFIDYTRATRIAVNVGRIIATVMVVLGLFGNPWLLVIGALIFLVGGQEYQVVRLRHSLGELTVAQIAAKRMDYVNGDFTLREFLTQIAKPGVEFYPVVNESKAIMSVLWLEDLRGLGQENLDKPIKKLARKPDVVDGKLLAHDMVTNLLAKEFVLVVDGKNVIGYITPDHLSEVARFQRILKT